MNHEGTKAQSFALTLYGRPTCEDTAITRDRLAYLGVPFHEIDVDQDLAAAQFVESVNTGNRVTPTLVIEPTMEALAEPGVTTLDEALRRAGVSITRPRVSEYLGPSADRPLVDFALPGIGGNTFRLSDRRGRKKTILFFAADHTHLACAGYARQLAASPALYADTGSQLVVVLADELAAARHWGAEFVPGIMVLADPDGAARQRVAAYLGCDANGVFALVLDRYTAPRVVSAAATPGGLLPPQELLEWLTYLDYECAE
jgi:mycoredoxin